MENYTTLLQLNEEGIRHLVASFLLLALVIIVGTVGNLFVIYNYARHIKNNPSIYLTVTLALYDLFICGVVAPWEVSHSVRVCVNDDQLDCVIHRTLENVGVLGSAWVVLAISGHCYIRICHPFVFIRKRTVLVVCGLSLLVTLPFTLPFTFTVYGINRHNSSVPGVKTYICSVDKDAQGSTMDMIYHTTMEVVFLVCILCLLFFNGMVAHKLITKKTVGEKIPAWRITRFASMIKGISPRIITSLAHQVRDRSMDGVILSGSERRSDTTDPEPLPKDTSVISASSFTSLLATRNLVFLHKVIGFAEQSDFKGETSLNGKDSCAIGPSKEAVTKASEKESESTQPPQKNLPQSRTNISVASFGRRLVKARKFMVIKRKRLPKLQKRYLQTSDVDSVASSPQHGTQQCMADGRHSETTEAWELSVQPSRVSSTAQLTDFVPLPGFLLHPQKDQKLETGGHYFQGNYAELLLTPPRDTTRRGERFQMNSSDKTALASKPNTLKKKASYGSMADAPNHYGSDTDSVGSKIESSGIVKATSQSTGRTTVICKSDSAGKTKGIVVSSKDIEGASMSHSAVKHTNVSKSDCAGKDKAICKPVDSTACDVPKFPIHASKSAPVDIRHFTVPVESYFFPENTSVFSDGSETGNIFTSRISAYGNNVIDVTSTPTSSNAVDRSLASTVNKQQASHQSGPDIEGPHLPKGNSSGTNSGKKTHIPLNVNTGDKARELADNASCSDKIRNPPESNCGGEVQNLPCSQSTAIDVSLTNCMNQVSDFPQIMPGTGKSTLSGCKKFRVPTKESLAFIDSLQAPRSPVIEDSSFSCGKRRCMMEQMLSCMIVIGITFIVCNLPPVVLLMKKHAEPRHIAQFAVEDFFMKTTFIQNAVHPIIYMVFHSKFRQRVTDQLVYLWKRCTRSW